MVTVMHERGVTVVGGRYVTGCVSIECAIGGSAEMCQIHTRWSHFSRQLVTVVYDDISLEKYVQLII